MTSRRLAGALLIVNSVLVLLGVLILAAAAVDLVVAGWSLRAFGYLVAGLLLAGLPLGLAFRSALRAGKRRG